MTNDLLKQAEAIAQRMELGRSDGVERRGAEQDMRALAVRYVAQALCRALAAGLAATVRQVSKVAATRSLEDRVRDPERTAIQ